ncbi:radical SAM protein [Clostridia bacterium]|nr:radical SAM protein [Clostridia bacterium]
MSDIFDIEKYLSDGVEALLSRAVKATFKNPKESAFLARYAVAAKRSAKLRRQAEVSGEHIPSFLIASITSDCNLSCAGCYARACNKSEASEPMSRDDWSRVFAEAEKIGVAMILLAGGEPLMRKDVILATAKYKNIIFSIFTNGTMLDGEYIKLLDRRRNLVPIISIEGNEIQTDTRRGIGVYKQTVEVMKTLREKGLLFGVSITMTTENINEVTDASYIDWLRGLGCKVALFVEYVPFEAKELALGNKERGILAGRLNALRSKYEDMILISFPGDEKETGGCLAAGRGFFHINANGGAEPCPFSPHSDTSLKTATLMDALQSGLFTSLRDGGLLMKEHMGGCTLFEFDSAVTAILSAE